MRISQTYWIAFVLMSLFGSSFSRAQEIATEDEVFIVRNNADVRFWQMDQTKQKLTAPRYPKDLLRAGVSGCISIGFYIEPDGTTSRHRILKTVIGDSDAGMLGKKDKRAVASMLGNASLASLAKLRYIPGPENNRRKRDFANIVFSYSADSNPLRGNCNIADLEAFLSAKVEAN